MLATHHTPPIAPVPLQLASSNLARANFGPQGVPVSRAVAGSDIGSAPSHSDVNVSSLGVGATPRWVMHTARPGNEGSRVPATPFPPLLSPPLLPSRHTTLQRRLQAFLLVPSAGTRTPSPPAVQALPQLPLTAPPLPLLAGPPR